jgi:hypothetical protein
VKDDTDVVFVFDLGGDFAVDDALEDGFRHGELFFTTDDPDEHG